MTVTGAGNSITSTTGIAVIISGTDRRRASRSRACRRAAAALTASSSSTPARGGFTVTGIGSTAGSGGTIANKTGADGSTTQGSGIYIDNTSNVSLSNMAISGRFQNFGIRGNNVVNFSLMIRRSAARSATISG